MIIVTIKYLQEIQVNTLSTWEIKFKSHYQINSILTEEIRSSKEGKGDVHNSCFTLPSSPPPLTINSDPILVLLLLLMLSFHWRY